MILHKISSAVAKNGYVVELVFEDGVPVDIDLSSLISTGGVWTAIADPLEFAKVKVAPNGRCIEWPGEVDLCADALWLKTRKTRPKVA